jgi:type IV pilus assembly protein PilB
MPVTPALKRIISRGGTADDIEKEALAEGMKTLRMGASEYVLQGITTVDEVKRITYED